MSYYNQRKKTLFINIDSAMDPFLICRGMICGIISVSISPSLYLPVIALLNGFIAGGMYIGSLIVSKSSDVDDTMHVS
jgi:ammonia channel protein AmtB